MSEMFELQQPQDAQDYLDAFESRTRTRGEQYFRQQRVGPLSCLEPGRCYGATVTGSLPYQVTLVYDDMEGWGGECTCPEAFECKHVYAALKSLLVENRASSVRDLSAGRLTRSPLFRATPKSEPPPNSELANQLVAAAARPLKREETAFLRKVHEVYERCRTSQRISNWDFSDLGFRVGGNSWDVLHIWPAFPKDVYEFWLYVAHAARERGLRVPEFLEPVTHLNRVAALIARWHRKGEVDRWKQLLGNLDNAGMVPAAGSRGVFDLRLAILEDTAALQWKRPGQVAFEPMKPTHFRQVAEDYENGRIELTPEAELLWEAYKDRVYYNRGPEMNFKASEGLEVLGRALRLRTLHDRIVNAAGQPMERAAEPLRWELAPAADEADDYRLQLVRADGSPLPPVLCTIEGHPPLCVTRDTIFTGTPVYPHLLPVGAETRIPAPALETRAGIQFLHALQVPLPPRLSERVRHVAMQVAIQCELEPIYPGSNTENCLVRVVAESDDGLVRETWCGQVWLKPSHKAVAKTPKDGSILVYDRTLMQEVPRWLEPLALKFDNYSGTQTVRVNKKFPELFVTWLRSLPPQVHVHLIGDLASLAQEAVSGQVRLDVTETAIDWFDLQVVLDVEDTTLSPEEIKLLLNAKGGYVRLKDKGWRRLQFNLNAEEDERLARLGLNPHELTAEPQRLHALQLADDAAKKFLPAQQVEQIQRRVGELKARVTPDVPSEVTALMRPYQRDGFHFLAYLAANRFGGILADDMGLGKTLQALAWLVWLRQSANGAGDLAANRAPSAAGELDGPGVPTAPPPEPAGVSSPSPRVEDRPDRPPHLAVNLAPPPKPSLVVCPKSVMDNWHAEAKRFTPGLRVKLWSPSELNTLQDRLPEADLHVLNYSQLRIVGESLVTVSWLVVILDEGQYIKNPNSQTAQVARALRADHRLVLTGTPIENRLLDLWSLMAFAMPGVLSSRHQFAKLFDAKDDPFARRRLASRVRPFLLRRTKVQVAKDLPDRIEEDLFCEIEGEQKTLYRAELKRAQQLLLKVQTQKQLAKERFHFLTSLLRLRQICCHPALVNPGTKAESAKLNALLEHLEPLMAEGNKVLVFSQFVEMLALLKTAIAQQNWPQFYLAGETENRGELVARFQAAEGPAVFLISLKAGGFGLNLTAASYVVLFDPWWNPAVENQAIDRTHRIGQMNKVIAYRLLIKDSVEEKIRAMQKQKKALADDVLGEEKFAQSLTLDDLHYLFAD